MTETDSYKLAINAVVAVLQTLTTYFPKPIQVSFDPYNITKGANYWFFISPFNSYTVKPLAGTTKIYVWQTPCELDVRFSTEMESANKLLSARGAIMQLLHKPRALKNVGVNKVILTPEGKPFQDTVPPNQPNFIIQKMNVVIEQIVHL